MDPQNPRTRFPSPLVSGLIMTLIAVSLFAIMRYGTQVQRAYEAQWSQRLEEESRTFCRTFTDAKHDVLLAECASHFLQAMKRHVEEAMERAAGPL